MTIALNREINAAAAEILNHLRREPPQAGVQQISRALAAPVQAPSQLKQFLDARECLNDDQRENLLGAVHWPDELDRALEDLLRDRTLDQPTAERIRQLAKRVGHQITRRDSPLEQELNTEMRIMQTASPTEPFREVARARFRSLAESLWQLLQPEFALAARQAAQQTDRILQEHLQGMFPELVDRNTGEPGPAGEGTPRDQLIRAALPLEELHDEFSLLSEDLCSRLEARIKIVAESSWSPQLFPKNGPDAMSSLATDLFDRDRHPAEFVSVARFVLERRLSTVSLEAGRESGQLIHDRISKILTFFQERFEIPLLQQLLLNEDSLTPAQKAENAARECLREVMSQVPVLVSQLRECLQMVQPAAAVA